MSSGDIMLIAGANEARFPDAHSLFVDDEVPAVIDPATRREDLERIEREHGVRLVINSHYHVDHMRYNHLFPGADFLAHRLDSPAIGSLDENARMAGIDEMPWADKWKSIMRDAWGYRETVVSRTIEDGEEVCTGANTLRFIHTPGHTPGHTCVQFVEKKAVYLGDIDLTGFGPWYGNRASDIDEFLASIDRLKRIDADTWYTAHGKGVYQGDIRDRLDAYAGVVYEREGKLLAHIEEAGPVTLRGLVDQAFVFGKKWEPLKMFEFFEGMMVKKHLERLERRDLVNILDDRWMRA